MFAEFAPRPFDVGVLDGANLHRHIVNGATDVPVIFRSKEASTFKFHGESQSLRGGPKHSGGDDTGTDPIDGARPVEFVGAREGDDEVEGDEDVHHCCRNHSLFP